MMHACYPLEKHLRECKASWDQYQQDWWKLGFDKPYVPYPYTVEMVQGWFAEYAAQGIGPLSVAEKKAYMEQMEQIQEEQGSGSFDGAAHKQFWMDNDKDSAYNWKKRTNLGGGG